MVAVAGGVGHRTCGKLPCVAALDYYGACHVRWLGTELGLARTTRDGLHAEAVYRRVWRRWLMASGIYRTCVYGSSARASAPLGPSPERPNLPAPIPTYGQIMCVVL